MARNTSVDQYIWGLRHQFSSMTCSVTCSDSQFFYPSRFPTACFTCFSQPVFAETPGFLPGGAYDTAAASNEVVKMWGFMAVKNAPKDMPKSCYIARFQILYKFMFVKHICWYTSELTTPMFCNKFVFGGVKIPKNSSFKVKNWANSAPVRMVDWGCAFIKAWMLVVKFTRRHIFFARRYVFWISRLVELEMFEVVLWWRDSFDR